MYSVIDIGSNTIRLTVYQVHDGAIETIFREKSNAGLAGYIDAREELSQEGIRRACDALGRFLRILDRLSIPNVSVFATASLRNIRNTQQAVAAIEAQTGCPIRVLSGEQEALLDYIGATHFLPASSGLLVDVGGGSTELVRFAEGKVEYAASMPIGSLNLYNKYVSHLLPDSEERKRIARRVDKELDKLALPTEPCGLMCGVGGTARAARKLVQTKAHPTSDKKVALSMFCALADEFQDERKETLLPLLKAAPDRIHTLIPGMLVLTQIVGRFHCDAMIVSDYGVREGYLLSEVLQVVKWDSLCGQ